LDFLTAFSFEMVESQIWKVQWIFQHLRYCPGITIMKVMCRKIHLSRYDVHLFVESLVFLVDAVP